MTKSTPENWPISRLQEHPRQGNLIGNLPDAQFDALCADIERRGLKHPPEILPDGTIVAGHQRCRAAKKLGWLEVPVIVRHDLAGNADAITLALMDDNLHNRAIDEIALAIIYDERVTIEERTTGNSSGVDRRDRVADMLSDRLGRRISGRTLDRWRAVGALPSPILDAYRAQQLTKTAAYKICALSEEGKAAIAKAIDDGVAPMAAVNWILMQQSQQTPVAAPVALPAEGFAKLLDHLNADLGNFEANANDLARVHIRSGETTAILQRAVALFSVVLERHAAIEADNIARTGSPVVGLRSSVVREVTAGQVVRRQSCTTGY